jgi:hypothetical protein
VILKPHEIMALEFLSRGPDCVGIIDSEEKMAAALIFIDLEKRGLVSNDRIDGERWTSITPTGRAALKRSEEHGT